MKTKLFTLLIAIAASVGTISAESGTCGENITWDLTDSVLTISGTGAMTNWSSDNSIPWYSLRASITSVTIGDSVTTIGSYAFYGCSSLTNIEIPNSVIRIERDAFAYCKGLTSIEIPYSVTSIGTQAFYNCKGITSLTIGNNVTVIGGEAFRFCSGLTNVTIPNSVTSIGILAFDCGSGLTEINVDIENNNFCSIDGVLFTKDLSKLLRYPAGKQGAYVIPNSVTSIEMDAFSYCHNLTSVTIPNSVTSIGGYAFYLCGSITSLTIGDSVIWIGNEAFYQCSGLTSVTIPNSVTSIGTQAFYNCKGITSLTIGNNVTVIGECAFAHCKGLTSVTIPNSVTSIGYAAFAYCEDLTEINVESGNSVYDSRNNCNAIIETATNTLVAGCQNTIITNSVTSIGNYAFNGCSRLASIEIPNSVTSIGHYAFDGSGLTSVEIPNSVTSIGGYAFYRCGLTKIEIPNSVTSIGFEAFYECYKLQSIFNLAITPQAIDNSVFEYVDKSIPLYVPEESVELYRTAEGWKEFANIKSINSYLSLDDPQEPGQYLLSLTAEPAEMGTITGAGLYEQGTEVEFSAIPNAGCRFVGWSDGATETTRTITLNRDTAFTALFIYDTLTVTGKKDITELRVTQEYPVAPSTHLFVKSDAHLTVSQPTSIYALTLYAEESTVAQVSNIANLTTENAELVWQMPENAEAEKWYAFAVPFDVAVVNGIYKDDSSEPAINGFHFIIDEYNGALRASTQEGWQRVATADTLRPGSLYMIAAGNAPKAWRFTAAHPETLTEQTKLSVAGYPSAIGDHHSGWNGIANTLWTNASASLNGVDYITSYDNHWGAYEVSLLSEHTFLPSEPFFIQVPADGSILFSKNASQPNNAPLRMALSSENTEIYTLGLTAVRSGYTDKAYMTLNENKEDIYTIGRDLEKMQSNNASVPQLWIEAYNMHLAAHEVLFADSSAYVPLGLYAPAAGTYQLQIQSVPENTAVYLMYNGTVLRKLSENVTELELTAGDNTSYGLYVCNASQIPQGVENVNANGNATKRIVNGQILIFRGDKIYTITGAEVK